MRDYEAVAKQAKVCASRKYCDIGGNCEYYDLDVCCQDGEKDILKDAADAIEELLAKNTNVPNKWISVEDRLPGIGEFALVTDGEDVDMSYRYIPSYISDEIKLPRWDSILNVTHWMPLPEPPKGVE